MNIQSASQRKIRNDLVANIDSKFIEKGWVKNACTNCGINFYAKSLSRTCGNEKCGENIADWSTTHNKITIPVEGLADKIKEYFLKSNYTVKDPIHMLHFRKWDNEKRIDRSIFAMAGVQTLDNILFDEASITSGKIEKVYLAQPSVRLNTPKEALAKVYGFYSSFLNASTVSVNPTVEVYSSELFLWVDLLEGLLGIKDLKISNFDSKINWDGRESPMVRFYFRYKGVELGDANYIYRFPQKSREPLIVGDIGFGLERICCIINKAGQDFDVIGPYSESLRGNKKLVDKIRALTLLVGSNILPGDTPYGTKIRSMIRDLIEIEGDSLRWFSLVPYFYAFWSNFTKLELSPVKIRMIIRDEIYRQYNKEIATSLKIGPPISDLTLPPHEFIENCMRGVYKQEIKIDSVNEAIKKVFRSYDPNL